MKKEIRVSCRNITCKYVFAKQRWLVFIVQLDRKQQLIILLLAAIILFGGGYRYAQLKERAALENTPQWDPAVEVAVKEIQVHITGAVEKPGVYTLTQGARAIEAVSLAGLLEEADADALRLAAELSDGQTLNVPYKTYEQAPDGTVKPMSGANPNPNGNLVDLNRADKSQLCTLPGIGPALAERIINYRETKGQFNSVEEIKKVSGIGDKKYQDLQDKITVN